MGKLPKVTWSGIAPSWLTGNASLLEAFAKHPRRLILGVLGSTLVGGVLHIWEQVLNFVHLLFFGSAPPSSSTPLMKQNVWGLADIPLAIAHELSTLVAALFSPITTAAFAFRFSWAKTAVSGLGIFAWPVAVAIAVGVLAVLDRVIMDGGPMVVSAIPVVGSPLAQTATTIRGWL